jgi:kynurenine formamidase
MAIFLCNSYVATLFYNKDKIYIHTLTHTHTHVNAHTHIYRESGGIGKIV